MKKRNIYISIFLVISFFTGFLTHALFFPTLFTNNLGLYIKRSMENKKAPVVENTNKALTRVTYENGQFDPQVVEVRRSYYLGIINTSDQELMTLISTNPLLQTSRGYGKSEEHLVQLYEKGTYEVKSALHPDSLLKVIVK